MPLRDMIHQSLAATPADLIIGTVDQALGSVAMRCYSHDNCENNSCTLACGSGETLASITCPSGTVSISKNGDVETVTCRNGQGPALALCMPTTR